MKQRTSAPATPYDLSEPIKLLEVNPNTITSRRDGGTRFRSCYNDGKKEDTPMSVVVDLPPQLERELATEAARFGLALPEYVVRVLSAGRLLGPIPRSGAELLTYWQGEGPCGHAAGYPR